MYRKTSGSWLKHLDFLILDIIVLQISFVIAFMVRHGFANLYARPLFAQMAIVFVVLQLGISILCSNYHGILRRGLFGEYLKTMQQSGLLLLLSTLYLFIVKDGESFSRFTLILCMMINCLLSYVAHVCYKKYLYSKRGSVGGKRSLLVITKKDNVERVLETIQNSTFLHYAVNGLVLLDDTSVKECKNIPVVANRKNMIDYVCRNWIDEVFLDISLDSSEYREYLNAFTQMGITVHMPLLNSQEEFECVQSVGSIGSYTVLTSTIKEVSTLQMFVKRCLDIMGGLVGCVITGILFIFIAPVIYIKSPGPIFFSQIRIGRNGKKFKIYKFRSMYLDAEERKKELMEQNNIKGGMMFKMDNDPRIIGSEKGPGKGIGNFIRKTSIDEFPQFLNVLKGDMSLVGTRPPTVDEWEKYELHHRVRMAIRPGLTGMWQVSGRSDIVDFEEVVRLDKEYIKNWNIGLDIKIILKTISVVLRGEGSK